MPSDFTKIDTHLHIWRRSPESHLWIHPGSRLDFDIKPDEVVSAMRASGISSGVLVQSDDTLEDLEQMLSLYEVEPAILGVVGWVPLSGADDTARALDQIATDGLVGVRQLPRAHAIDLSAPSWLSSLTYLARRGICVEFAAGGPHRLQGLAYAAERVPELTFVLDHLGTPPEEIAHNGADWLTWLHEASRPKNVVAKFSAVSSRPDSEQLWELALEEFGPARLMIGSDWPVSHGGNYSEAIGRLDELAAQLSEDEHRAVWAGTGFRTYGGSRS